ncbi:conserved hypothetical protein [Bathymodiolus platifrons methanotrophic gill symbiont]|uniref:hypothetical protein n=1 Tax=Bathymodiolus platifrons methanotrophic gill symbiont TaxID=113268 RepID=UPI000B408BC2|nr:hypothetical protein [Bathymodiolus platifrons methanotrophic gill symbiont]GAW87562.1 conserved hypothetical protein [Bathymodiolus platifrons methanotrophic gill symbiont]GFO77251.1 hypothetical protein BPLS_P5585 [Bathymodiolus platifrons methanotrophic gill symbiont]
MQPQTKQEIKVPKMYLTILNHLYEIERKVGDLDEFKKITRNIEKIKNAFLLEDGNEISYEDPMGQKFDETRLDLEAHIVGTNTENLEVIDVVKPIIRVKNQLLGRSYVVQRGIVSVESK